MRDQHLAKRAEAFADAARTIYAPGRGVVFRCEACGHELHDLRAVLLAHCTAGWRIECSIHEEPEYLVDAGRLFGGGLHALEVFGDLAHRRWFDPADLFRAFLRLRGQANGLYVAPRIAAST
jgi:hypothetical protein